MPGDNVSIRNATEGDLAWIQAIYAHYVNHGLASFGGVQPNITKISRRRDTARDHDLSYLVAEKDDTVQGFAYGSLFRGRPGVSLHD